MPMKELRSERSFRKGSTRGERLERKAQKDITTANVRHSGAEKHHHDRGSSPRARPGNMPRKLVPNGVLVIDSRSEEVSR